MAKIGLGFQLTASATQMSRGINAGVVELQKLGYAAKKTAADVSTLKNIELGRVFLSAAQSITNTFNRFTSGTANAIDSTAKLARSLGISYQELQQLQIAADLSGASSEQLANAFTRASVTITEAGNGSKSAIESLGRLGLTVDELAGKSTNVQFGLLADAISRIQDPAQRAAAAVQIFGRSGAQLLPTFQELSDNLQVAQGFLARFQNGLTDEQARKVEQVNDAFSLVRKSIEQVTGRLLVELNPALLAGSNAIIDFVSKLDVRQVAEATRKALQDVAGVLALASSFAAPLAKNLLPAIGAYLAFINRQAIASGIISLANVVAKIATAFTFYGSTARAAAASTAILATSVRALVVSTGIGALVVGLGVAAGYLADWALAGKTAGGDVVVAIDDGTEAARQFQRQMQQATAAATGFGEEVKRVLKVPGEITLNEFAQGSLDQARSAIVSLAKELGGLDQVPREVLDTFRNISTFANQITNQSNAQAQAVGVVDRESKLLLATVNGIVEARRAEADAAKAAADESRRAAEQASADARRRVQGLAEAGLTDAEKNRITLAQDLLAIQQTLANAEASLAAARREGDAAAIRQAQERLAITQQTAAAARRQAIEQNRQGRLNTLGIDNAILQPVRTIADQLQAVRQAFREELLTPQQARNAVLNLAADGIRIREELAAELARPSQQALQATDIRSQEGISQLLSSLTGREDPAIAQRREQLNKLDEIRRALVAIGVQPVDILGG